MKGLQYNTFVVRRYNVGKQTHYCGTHPSSNNCQCLGNTNHKNIYRHKFRLNNMLGGSNQVDTIKTAIAVMPSVTVRWLSEKPVLRNNKYTEFVWTG